jgi:hypothetical protein
MKKSTLLLFFFLFAYFGIAQAAIFNTIVGSTNYAMFVPDGIKSVRGIIYNSPGSNGTSIAYASNTTYMDMANLYSYAVLCHDNGGSDTLSGGGMINAIQAFSIQSNLPSLVTAPMYVEGFSAGAGNSWWLAVNFPERIIGYNINKGSSSSHTNLTATGLLVPGMNCRGTIESASQMEGQEILYSNNRCKLGALLAFAIEQGSKHATGETFKQLSNQYLWQLEKIRNPNGALPLMPVNEQDGWLADTSSRATPMMKIYPYALYPGDKKTASWLLNKDMAYTFAAFCTFNKKLTIAFKSKPRTEGSKVEVNVTFGDLDITTIDSVVFYDYSQRLAMQIKPATTVMLASASVKAGVHSFLAIAYIGTTGYISEAIPDVVIPVIQPTALNEVHRDFDVYVKNGKLILPKVEQGTLVNIYSAAGLRVLSTLFNNTEVRIGKLPKGIYVACVGNKTAKFSL